jgi:superfamily II DNA or RNA helicase
MNEKVQAIKIDEVHMKIVADRGILRELSEYFSFYVPGYKFSPKFRNKQWDGTIKIFNLLTQQLYVGLLEELSQFCKERDYDLEYDYLEFAINDYSKLDGNKFIENIVKDVKIPNFEIRDYQVTSFIECIRNNRALLLSPTSSGKSFMIYLLIRYYDLPTLLIVDGLGPIHQMAEDLVSYGHDENDIHKVFASQSKISDKLITISTWQSVSKEDKDFFDRFGLIIGDEAHHFQAKTFIDMMKKTTDIKYKFGFTGTIEDTESQCNPRILQGLFGKIIKVVSTSELIEQGYISDLRINCLIFQYPNEIKKPLLKASYVDEMNFICSNEHRNNFIKNLVLSKINDEENTILFFNFVDKHGKILYDMIKSETNKPVFFIHGGVDGSVRNDIRKVFEDNVGITAVASFGTFQTSISINNLHNLIFGSPFKSKIRNLQSIGRGLRKHHSKEFVSLYDLSDNLILGSHKNHTIKHFAKRVEQYDIENFKYKFFNIKLGDK